MHLPLESISGAFQACVTLTSCDDSCLSGVVDGIVVWPRIRKALRGYQRQTGRQPS